MSFLKMDILLRKSYINLFVTIIYRNFKEELSIIVLFKFLEGVFFSINLEINIIYNLIKYCCTVYK